MNTIKAKNFSENNSSSDPSEALSEFALNTVTGGQSNSQCPYIYATVVCELCEYSIWERNNDTGSDLFCTLCNEIVKI